jgi:hypothetical protein
VDAPEPRRLIAMNPRTTGILLLVAAALFAFVYFYEIRGEDARRDAEELGKRLFPEVEQGDIDAVSLTTRGGALARLERREDAWTLVEPLEFPADGFAADGLASSLATLASEARLEDPQPPAEYGLDEGSARIVRFRVGEAQHELRLGKDTPVGSSAYAATASGDAVYTVERFKAQSFDKALDDLRDKRILDFDESSIRRVEASWPGGRVVLEREGAAPDTEAAEPEATDGWRLRAPLDARADSDAIDDLLSDLSFLRADGFVDDPPPDAEVGLLPPEFQIVLSGPAPDEGGEATRVALAVGGLHEEDKRLVRAARQSLYLIPASRLDDFPREVVAYRFKQLARFSAADARQVELYFQSGEGDPVAVSATHGRAGWAATPEPMDPERLSRMVSELSNLEASDILAESMGEQELGRLGLSPPNAIVSVYGEAPAGEPEEGAEAAPAPRLAEIHLGSLDPLEGIAARAVGDATVYRLDLAIAEHVPVSLEALRSRFLVDAEPESDDAAVLQEEGEGLDFLSPTEESP